MAIFVIRHGETPLNAARVLQTPDTPLSERGRGQAERVGQRLVEAGIVKIIASDYARVHMTAEHIQAATGAPLHIEEHLRERNFGDIRGRSYTEAGDFMALDFHPPGGESWDDFHNRIDNGWERIKAIRSATEGNLAIVTHGLVCYSLALRQWRLPAGQPATRDFANTSVTIVQDQPPWEVHLLNCSAHLDGH